MEDRSALFNQLKNFSQRKLKKVETKVVTASGEQLVEKRGAKGLQVLTGQDGSKNDEAEPARKLDLQVGLVLPGFLIGAHDVAHDKSSLDSYGVTHILSLDADVENKFEDDYNYKNINIQDKPDFDLNKVLEDCFDFIDDGRHYGNVLIHCSGTVGLSRSTAICIAYLMSKEKQKFDEAFNNVKEARSFVKPNEGFIKQLKEYEVKLRGAQEVKDSGIDDPFALRKKQEIEQEKAMVAGAASVKNRMKMFGATLDTGSAGPRSKSVSPSPFKSPTPTSNQTGSKWSSGQQEQSSATGGANKTVISKSMTPEPRKSWQATESRTGSSGPPPPPPPMPSQALHLDDKSIKPLNTNTSSISSRSPLPPPPPPPMPSGDPLKGNLTSKTTKLSSNSSISSNNSNRSQAQPETPPTSTDFNSKRMVFGRVPPPAMKIKGGLSIERHDSSADQGLRSKSSQSKASYQLPLKKQFTSDSGSEAESSLNVAAAETPRAPSPSAALRAAKQQAASRKTTEADGGSNSPTGDHRPSTCGQLNRSSTKKLLNLIKTKTKTDLTLSDGDENDEIDALLGALESESIENIDWDELGLDEDEVKDIIKKGAAMGSSSSSSSSASSSSSDDSEEEVEEEEEVETSTQHFIIRSK